MYVPVCVCVSEDLGTEEYRHLLVSITGGSLVSCVLCLVSCVSCRLSLVSWYLGTWGSLFLS